MTYDSSLDERVISAASSGRIDFVKNLVSRRGASPNAALFGAAAFGDMEFIRDLVCIHEADPHYAICGSIAASNMTTTKLILNEFSVDVTYAALCAMQMKRTDVMSTLVVVFDLDRRVIARAAGYLNSKSALDAIPKRDDKDPVQIEIELASEFDAGARMRREYCEVKI